MSIELSRLIPTGVIVGGSLALYSILSGNSIMADCAYEYETSCKIHAIGSAEADKCLRDLGDKASPKCVAALTSNEPMKLASTEEEVSVPEQKPEALMPKNDAPMRITQEIPATAEPVKEVVPVPTPVIAKTPVTTEPIPNFPPKEEVVEKTEAKKAAPKAESKPVVKRVAYKAEDDDTFARLGRSLDSAKNSVTRAVKETAKAVSDKYKKVTKENIEYAKRPEIIEQNIIRKHYVDNNFIMPEGVNANFGRR